MNTTDEMSRSLVAQRAAEWFVENRSGKLSPDERAEFTAWLKASPEHVREYLAVAGFSREMTGATRALDVTLERLLQEAAQDDGANVASLYKPLRETDNAQASAPKRSPKRFATAASLVAIGMALATVWALRDGERWGLAKTYRTAHAEQGIWRLPDGSVMQLNSESHVRVRFSKTDRFIEVANGQAYFRVAHEPARQFRVTAGGAEVVAIGTEFDVYRRRDATVVTVVEGKVAVLRQGENVPVRVDHSPTPRDDQRPRFELAAGQQVKLDSELVRPKLVQADLRQSTAWLQREIVFEQRPLKEVAEEFNRYSHLPIVIADAELGMLPISGVFNAYDTDSFIAFLRRLDGVAVEKGARGIRVLSQPTPPIAQPLTVAQ